MDNRDHERKQFEDWHRYGKERGFFDRAADVLRSWFGDEHAERRRMLDAEMDESRGRMGHPDDHDIPLWQQRDYSGASPRGGDWEERGRFVGDTSGMRRQQQNGQRSRYGGEHQLGYGGHQQPGQGYEREDQSRRRPENSGRQFNGQNRDFESGLGWGDDRQQSGMYGQRFDREARGGDHDRNWEREQRQGSGGIWGGEQQRGGFFGERQETGGGMFSGGNRGRGPRNYQRSDERIMDEIHQIITFHPEIDATEIEVIVDKGVVTLRGKVDDRASKRLTEDVCEDVYGVREVHNELRVDNPLFKRNNENAQQRGNLVNKQS